MLVVIKVRINEQKSRETGDIGQLLILVCLGLAE